VTSPARCTLATLAFGVECQATLSGAEPLLRSAAVSARSEQQAALLAGALVDMLMLVERKLLRGIEEVVREVGHDRLLAASAKCSTAASHRSAGCWTLGSAASGLSLGTCDSLLALARSRRRVFSVRYDLPVISTFGADASNASTDFAVIRVPRALRVLLPILIAVSSPLAISL